MAFHRIHPPAVIFVQVPAVSLEPGLEFVAEHLDLQPSLRPDSFRTYREMARLV